MPKGVYQRKYNCGFFQKGHKVNIGRIPWNKGNIGLFRHSKETIKKIVKNHRRLQTDSTKEKISLANGGKTTRKGYHLSEEHKRKIGLANYRGCDVSLNNKIRVCFKYKVWRITILKRDSFSCVLCGYNAKKKREIQVDHIKAFSIILIENNIKTLEEAQNCEELWDISNGRTLCIFCHKKETYKLMDIIRKKIIQKSWKIPSNSDKGKWHEVRLVNGVLKCTCIAGSMRQECSHIKYIKEFKNEEFNF